MSRVFIDATGKIYNNATPLSSNDMELTVFSPDLITVTSSTPAALATVKSAFVQQAIIQGHVNISSGLKTVVLLVCSLLAAIAGDALSNVAHAAIDPCFVQPANGVPIPCPLDPNTNVILHSGQDTTVFTGGAVNGNLSVAGTVSSGLFTSGVVTNPTSNQVVLGVIDTTGASSMALQLVVASGTTPRVSVQESATGAAGTWLTIYGYASSTSTQLQNSFTNNNAEFTIPVRQRYIQVIVDSAVTGVFTLNAYLRVSPFSPTLPSPYTFWQVLTTPAQESANTPTIPTLSSSSYEVTLPYSVPESTWQYSTAGTPITTATSTTIQAAGAASTHQYITDIVCTNGNTTADDLLIEDGASTVMADFMLQSDALVSSAAREHFLVPLRAPTAASLVKLVTSAAGSINCTISGYTAF